MSNSSTEIDDQERAGFLTEKIYSDSTKENSRRRSMKVHLVTAINVLLFITSCSLFGTWYYQTHWQLNAALRRTSTYSPIYDRLDLDMKPKFLNGTLFTPKNPSIARQMPNPEADAIWDEWELTRYVPVTAAEIRKMGKDPSTVAKLEDKDWGLGDDAYAAIFDVYHQLHCLNQLRKIAYNDYYNTSKASLHHHKQKGEMYECSGNVNLITMHYVAEQSYPFPDMSINKQCTNFDKLTQWRLENTIDLDEYVAKMEKKEDGSVKELPAPDDYYKYFMPGKTNPNHLNGANPGNDFNL